MAAAHPTSQTNGPNNLSWRWAGEPELVLENGDKVYSACIRPKDEGGHDDGGAGTSVVRDKEGRLEVGDCFAFKIMAHESQPVGLITRLSEEVDSEGQCCAKIVTYKPFVKLSRLPNKGANFTKCSLMESVATMNLTANKALLLCSREKQAFLRDCIIPVTVPSAIHYQQFCASTSASLYQKFYASKSENPSTGGSKASEEHGTPSFCCVGLYNLTKRYVKLLLDEDIFLKDYILPELTFLSSNEVEEDVSDEDELDEAIMLLHELELIVYDVNINE